MMRISTVRYTFCRLLRNHSRCGLIPVLLLLCSLMSSCSIIIARTAEAQEIASTGVSMEDPMSGEVLTPLQEKLVEGARSFVGTAQASVNGVAFPADCSGTLLAIYAYAGIDLTDEFARKTGTGVVRLYRILEERGLLYNTKQPAVGDIIFWDNTYDRNNDGILNDKLTHAGMVVTSSGDGRVEYVHYHYSKGIVIENMDLKRPDLHTEDIDGKTVIVNAPIKMKGVEKEGSWLSGQLYNAFGKGYDIKDKGGE